MNNKIFAMIAALFVLMAGSVRAESLKADNVIMNAGTQKSVGVTLAQDGEKYAGFQFDVELPSGVSLISEELVAAQTGDMTLVKRTQDDGSIRFIVYSPTLSKVHAGKVMMLQLKADKKTKAGEYSLKLKNVMLTDADGHMTYLSDAASSLTVAPPVKVTAVNIEREYGDENGLLDYEVSENYTIGLPTIDCAATQYSPVGTYSITVGKGSIEADTVTLVNGTLTITKAPLTISGGEYKMKMGEPLPTFKASYSGFKNGETEAVLIQKPTLKTTATSSSEPGTYDINVSGAEAENYEISYEKGTLTIEVSSFTLTYLLDGEVYKTVSYDYGSIITPEPAPSKEGYTFSGWSDVPETMPAHDVTITGSFYINKYTLTYMVDDKEYKSFEIEYGTSITPETEPVKEGYTFSGWSWTPKTMPAEDVTVTGTFSINKYKLLYMVDGEVYKSYEIEYGSKITPEPAPTKEGYSFSGWSDIPTTMPANDVTVTGTFSKGSYKLTYMVDGEVYKTISFDYGIAITPEPAPSKEGYTFSGWSDVPETMPAHDVTITGSFYINKYTLTYMVDDKEYKSFEIEYGTSITPEAEPVKEGYTFSGWSWIPKTMPAEDVTITGTFTINKYKLTYMVDGELYKSYEIEYGEKITPEPAPTKEGYTFSGWSNIPTTMPANDVTVTGTFSKGTYKLIYMVDGEVYKTISFDYGIAITPEPVPSKEGYTFSGWSGVPVTMPAHDVTVTGSFSINKYKLIYMVDDKEYKSFEIEYGTSITPETEPVKEGYTFSGWSWIPKTMPAEDVTVTGTFSINKYKLTYMVDNKEYKSFEIEYGTSITPEAEPVKEGYTFSGWSWIPKTMSDEDVTVTGTFSINKYKLLYMVDGEVYKSYEIEYGSKITPEPAPTKEGYTFSGWSNIPTTMPANDVTVTGTFSKGTYKLIYMVDGEVYKTISFDYGIAITPEPDPSKEGYSFSGWSGVPETMPAHDVTVTGTFSVNKYKLTYMIGDETYKEVEIEYGSTIPTEPQPDGDYVRFEWVGVPETMPAHDVIVYADFETGIVDVMALQGVRCIYSPNGKRISKLQEGVNIVVMNDGSVKKVYVR